MRVLWNGNAKSLFCVAMTPSRRWFISTRTAFLNDVHPLLRRRLTWPRAKRMPINIAYVSLSLFGLVSFSILDGELIRACSILLVRLAEVQHFSYPDSSEASYSFIMWHLRPPLHCSIFLVCTVGQNNQEYRLGYWATRSSIHSFAHTTHSFA